MADAFVPYRTGPQQDALLDARLRNIEAALTSQETAADEQIGSGNAVVTTTGATLSGDVTGPTSANTVQKIKSQSVTNPATVAGQVMVSPDGAVWTPDVIDLAGDVTGDYNANTVAKIRGKTTPTPGAGDDKHYLRYDHAGAQYVLAAASTLALLGGWKVPDVSALTTAFAEIANGLTDTNIAVTIPVVGELVGISIRLSGDVGGVGDNFIATAYLNGSPTTVTATVTGGAGTEVSAQATFTPVALAAGDFVTVQAKKAGAAAAVVALVTLWCRFTG